MSSDKQYLSGLFPDLNEALTDFVTNPRANKDPHGHLAQALLNKSAAYQSSEVATQVAELERANKGIRDEIRAELKKSRGGDESKEDMSSGSQFNENKANEEMDRYSRAIAAVGVETMKNLGTLNVLVIGLNGVGIEAAKNLVLAGPKGVSVYDPAIARVEDLGANFYLDEQHVGKVARQDAVLSELQDLNPYVKVKVHQGDLAEGNLQEYGCVVVTHFIGRSETARIDEWCRANNVPFILAQTYGLTALFFSDFGASHTVTDADGENVDAMVVEKMNSFGVVTVAADKHGLADGDMVKVTEFEGKNVSSLNDTNVKVKRVYKKIADVDKEGKQREDSKGNKKWRNVLVLNQFQIVQEEGFNFDWKNGGIVEYVKPTREMKFRSFTESLQDPCVEDFAAMMNHVQHMDDERSMAGAGSQMHLAYVATLEFASRHNDELPRLHSYEDAKEVVSIAHELKEKWAGIGREGEAKALQIETVNDAAVEKFALLARTELTGLCAFLGGVVAQEVVKKFGKYTPVWQWVYVDYQELIPEGTDFTSENYRPRGVRYDHQISIFGDAVQQKIFNQKWFLVGCGALGCEYIKGIALMGVGAKSYSQESNGVVYITDMDRIELSNLSRQFLFRKKHVGKPKSSSAFEVAQGMNPDTNMVCYEMKVAPDTEEKFNNAFWDSLDGVWNALDNMQARLYTDGKCCMHGKPLLESGTEGTKANSSIHVPHQTASYGETPVQETGGIPACTLRNFPHLDVHCIEWAKPKFEKMFEWFPKNINKALEDSSEFFESMKQEADSERLETMTHIKNVLSALAKADGGFKDCIQFALDDFTANFDHLIRELIYCFPEDSRVTAKTDEGEEMDLGPFWTGHKRFPDVASFDANNQLHFDYVYNTANLYAFTFGVEHVRDQSAFRSLLNSLNYTPPEWNSASAKAVAANEEDHKKMQEEAKDKDMDAETAAAIAALEKDIAALAPQIKIRVQESDFEKDDDTNFHIDFITACSNLRAANYKIQPATRLRVKIVAGKIIPALASTTAMISGLTEMEFYKLVLGLNKHTVQEGEKKKEINPFFNSNVNLATSTFHLFNAGEPAKNVSGFDEALQCEIKSVPEGYTRWDFVRINEPTLTVQELIDKFPSIHHNVSLVDISSFPDAKSFLFEDFAMGERAKTYAKRKTMTVKEAYEDEYGPLDDGVTFLMLDGSYTVGEEEDAASCPPIKFNLK